MINKFTILLVIILLVMPFSIAESLQQSSNLNAEKNTIEQSAEEISANYDSLGRKVSGTDPDTGVSNYTYDAVGNLIQQSTGGGNLVTGDGYYREYDDFGRLRAIYEGSSGEVLIEEYVYDGNGERIKTRNYPRNETTYTPFREFTMIINSSGQYNYTYVYDGSDTLVARINPDGSKWYYHADHLGSTTLITNQSGDVIENTFYEPYGAVESGKQIYLVNRVGNHFLVRFDKATFLGNQTWAFNYVEPGENLTGMNSLFTIFNVMEGQGLTYQQIVDQVKILINSTIFS